MLDRRWLGLAVAGGLACGGGGDGRDSGADGTDGGIVTASTTGATTGVTDSGTMGADTGTGTGGLCDTVLCGVPEVCCESGTECAAGQCQPICDSGVRCGDGLTVCCPMGDVCLADACVTPTGTCVDSFDCDFGEFCEPTLDQCLPQAMPVACEVIPEFQDLDATLEWSAELDEIISIPVVADLDGDGIPEVVVNITQQDGLSWPGGNIVILDGQTGQEIRRIPHDPPNLQFGAHGRSTIGLTDVSGDGLPDIIYAGRDNAGRSPIYAIDGQGQLLWTSHDAMGAEYRFNVNNGAPSFANFDADDASETVFGATLIDDDGLVVWDEGGGGNGSTFGTNQNYTGGISSILDLTGDGFPEIVSGQHAWSVDWQAGPVVTVTPMWDAGTPDGYPAIADLDLDGDPEVVIVASGTVRALDGATGQLWCGVDPTDAMCVADPLLRTQAVPIPGGGRGGPPTIADFDGDGRPEIAAAAGASYSVYDLNRAGEVIVQPVGDPPPAAGDIFIRWSQVTQDQSSNTTGSSVFDFQGDGVAEVVYADECFMRVYSGEDGTILLEVESSSATIHEYPLVVDMDADGNSEILVVANDSGANCVGIPGYTERRGLFAYGDTFDQWVRTRRVWTSHAYHVTNTTSAGNAPPSELDNWSQPGLNNYRQNVQGEGVFNAPDLSAELAVGLGGCMAGELELIATIRNEGSLGVPSGIDVSLYEGTDATGMLVGTVQTTEALLPGAFTTVSWIVPAMAQGMDYFVEVDGITAMPGVIVECDESNNGAQTLTAACPMPG